MRWTGHTVGRSHCKILFGRQRSRWEDIIKSAVREIRREYGKWIRLVQDKL
jgi:hypothetical protein